MGGLKNLFEEVIYAPLEDAVGHTRPHANQQLLPTVILRVENATITMNVEYPTQTQEVEAKGGKKKEL